MGVNMRINTGDTEMIRALSILRWLLPEVAPKVGNNILVCAFLHHEDFLLDDGKVVPWKQSEKKKHRRGEKKQPLISFFQGELRHHMEDLCESDTGPRL